MHEHFSPFPIHTPELVIQGLGAREVMPPCMLDRPGGWPHYLIVLFYDAVQWEVAGAMQPLEPGTVVIWEPQVRQCFGNPQRRWNHSWFSASGSIVSRAVRESGLPCNVPFRPADTGFVDRSLIELYAELKEQAAVDPVIAANLTVNLVRRLRRDSGSNRSGVPAPMVAVKRHVDTCFAEELSLDDLAERAGMSVSQLCLSYKRHYGTPLMAYVRGRRLSHAAMLLRDTRMKVADVARTAGFGDVYHFSKAFKQHFGITPGAARGGGEIACAGEMRDKGAVAESR